MSDLPRAPRELSRSMAQLPVSWYFDQNVFEMERCLIFKDGSGYVGHELMVPEVGDFHTLAATNHGQMLVRTAEGVRLLSNVCRHRQALMLNGRGNARSIICPVHRWTYQLDGRLLGAPSFEEQPCTSLHNTPLSSWNGLLFEGTRDVAADLARMGCAADFDFSGYMFDHVEVNEYRQNWKTFIEVYLEDYHVAPFHPGLGGFVNCDDLKWEFNDRYSVQVVGVNNGLRRPGTPVYEKWHAAVRAYAGEKPPAHGAIWLTYYPNVMVEWYPHVLIVSTLIPRSPQHTTNIVEFYYPEEIVLFEREFVEAEQAAYRETAAEDDDIARRMDAGRAVLHAAGRDEAGPYQSPMEDGMMHFHEYIRRQLAAGTSRRPGARARRGAAAAGGIPASPA
jgi:choline monooxygenase